VVCMLLDLLRILRIVMGCWRIARRPAGLLYFTLIAS
jgi:hypothetical protein